MPFFTKFGSERQNYQFELKFGTYNNSNTCANFNGDVHYFFVSNQKCAFLGKGGPNLTKNVKFVSLRLNLLASLIRICRIQRWCSLFSFSIGNALFWANLVEKAKMISLS